jgi:hypothetical protein
VRRVFWIGRQKGVVEGSERIADVVGVEGECRLKKVQLWVLARVLALRELSRRSIDRVGEGLMTLMY